MMEIKQMVKPWNIHMVRNLTEASYILRFSRNGMDFKPGQHLVAGTLQSNDAREYSIYSGMNDDYLEILIREVEEGKVSKKLHSLKKGDILDVKGPYGFYMYNTIPPLDKKLVFIASGTGIAPFHSFARSMPGANYQIIHGIRNIDECYDKDHYPGRKYFSCTSRDDRGDFPGRLTEYLKSAELEPDSFYYFCGNSDMILNAMDILKKRGVPQSRMYTEVYF